MKLRTSILLILSGVAVLYAAVAWGIQRLVIFPGFVSLEEREGEHDVTRAREAIQNEIHHLDKFCQDWGVWDDTYEFVVDRNEAYIAANLYEDYFKTGRYTLLYYFDLEGRLVWGENRDPENEFALLPLEDLPARDWPLDHPLLTNRETDKGTSGLYMTERGPFFVSARPILTSEQAGPMRGWILMGKLLTGEMVAALNEQTRVEFRVWPLGEPGLEPAERAAATRLVAGQAVVFDPRSEELLHVWSSLSDFAGRPALLLRADVPREITAHGAGVLDFALLSTLAAAGLVLLVLLVLLQRSVISPLSRLTSQAVAIGRSDDLSVRLELDRQDEIGVLSREFDCMVERLARAREQLLETARLSGMSEVATSVLHNVGNALNSVNVSASTVGQKLSGASFRDLERVIDVLTLHAQDLGEFVSSDPKGRHFPAYLKALLTSLREERDRLRNETHALELGLEHIKSLVDAQQDLAGKQGVIERVSLAAELERALVVSQAERNGISIVREIEALAPLELEKHRVLEILVNLLRNAAESIEAHGGAEKRICLRLQRHEPERVAIEVQDSGSGIAPENLTRIFNHGFTTKPSGHGFGLHASANSAKGIGGRLYARSDGVGRGASFVLELPLHAPAGMVSNT